MAKRQVTRLPGIVLAPLETPGERRVLRVLHMVHELHKAGYQRLRVCPGLSSSNLYWRCAITPVTNVLRSDGASVADYERQMAFYSTADTNRFFKWNDASRDTARQLAAKFLDRFAAIARRGYGNDFPYVGWYVLMLGCAERGAVPIAYAGGPGFEAEPGYISMVGTTGIRLQMPPPGEAEPAK